MSLRLIPVSILFVTAPLVSSAASPAGTAPGLAQLAPAALIASACGFAKAGEGATTGKGAAPMPLIDGLAPIHYPVTAQVADAQRYFDQGMAFLYGFEFSKAERSFREGAARDPGCAMCLWGQALAIGPYINSGPPGAVRIVEARALVDRALVQPGIADNERALIEALRLRYAPDGPAKEKGVHEAAFADRMLALSERWPADDMIMVLAAEAAMNVRPWDYWEADNRTPRPLGARAIRLVETVLARNPRQPEAQHLYIHLTEASMTPGRAERAADMLRTEAPASAHLVHMPSHTYYRLGRFADGVATNQAAIGVDEAMARRLGEDTKFYGYFGHHTHFILSASEQIGDRTQALAAADNLEAYLTADRVAANAMLQSRLATAMQVRAQFARTLEEALAIPEPDARLPDMRQMWWAIRAEALARNGQPSAASEEIARMRRARGKAPVAQDLRPMVKIAETVALARIAEANGKPKAAARLLRKAADVESRLPYNEPPLWHQPVDATLGGVLLRSGDAQGAKTAFDRALIRRPGNVWALWGRAQAEAALGDHKASAGTLEAYRRNWAGGSDTPTLARL